MRDINSVETGYEDALKWLSEGKIVKRQLKKHSNCFTVLFKQENCDHISYRHPFFECITGKSIRTMRWSKLDMLSMFDFEREYEYSIVNEGDLPELDKEITRRRGFVVE